MNDNFIYLLERILIYTIVTPLLFLLIHFIDVTIINDFDINNERIYINFFTYLIIGFSGALFLFIFNIFVAEKTKIAIHFVFIIFYILVELLFCYVTANYDLPAVIVLTSVVMYFLEERMYMTFVYHEKFVDEWGNLEGKKLETYLYHNNIIAQDLSAQTRKFKTLLIVLGFFFLLVTAAFYLTFNKIDFFAVVLSAVFVVSEFLMFFILGFINKESYFANLGFRNIIFNKKQYLKVIMIIFAFSAVLSLFVSKNKSLLKLPEYHFISTQKETVELPEIKQNSITDFEIESHLKDAFVDDYKPNPIWDIIFTVFKYVIIAALLIYIFYFLLKIFLSTGWKSFWGEKKLYYFFRKMIDKFKDFFSFLFSKNVSERYSTVNANTFKDSIQNLLKKSDKSKEKKAELDKFVKHFMNLIVWGEKHSAVYKKNLAPAEYTLLIAEYFNTFIKNENNIIDENEELKDNLQNKSQNKYEAYINLCHKIGFLFEKALYDKNILSKEEYNEYSDAVNTILKIKE